MKKSEATETQPEKITRPDFSINTDFSININKDNSRIKDYPDAEERLKTFSIRHVRSIEDQCLFYILEGLHRDMQKNESAFKA